MSNGNGTNKPGTDAPWTWFAGAGVAFVAAILCFTPLWQSIAPDGLRDSGRRAGISNLLYTLGPAGVVAIVAAVGVIFLLIGLNDLRKSRR